MIQQYLKQLNPQQLEAVQHFEGPCMVYAGPGSGKTTVITHRVGYLIDHYKVDANKILVISFTKAAADEMKSRFEESYQYFSSSHKNVSFGTFHSTFFKILRSYYRYNLGNILDEGEKIGVIKNIVKTLNIGNELDDDLIKDIILDVGLFKSNILDQDNFTPNSISKEDFERVVFSYETYKKDSFKIDFDDMLTKCYQLLVNQPSVLQSIRDAYQYILIDEFQDINSIQFEIIKLIVASRKNLFVVGDDDQSIYSFRGANPNFILEFDRIFKNTKKIILNLNYRSQEIIIDTANKLISNNEFRVDKKMISTKNPGVEIQFSRPKTREMENQEVSEVISTLLEEGYTYRDIAVIYRTNILSSSIVDSFLDNNIPFISRDNIYNIYEHWMAKDIVAYLKATVNLNDREALKRIINRPTRYITNKAKKDADEYHKDFITSLRVKGNLMPYQVTYLDKLEVDLKNLKSMDAKEAIHYIRKDIGYDDYINNYCLEKGIHGEGLLEILDELEDISLKHGNTMEFLNHINEFKKSLQENKRSSYAKGNQVELLTMHSAKGLEFKVVIIIEALEEIIPHSKSQDEESIEEERRLFYVAITRAKERLYIYSPMSKYDKKADVSRFIGEMELFKEKLNTFQKGQEIFHKVFGKGLIQKADKNMLKVWFFKSNETKDLDLAICAENNLIS